MLAVKMRRAAVCVPFPNPTPPPLGAKAPCCDGLSRRRFQGKVFATPPTPGARRYYTTASGVLLIILTLVRLQHSGTETVRHRIGAAR